MKRFFALAVAVALCAVFLGGCAETGGEEATEAVTEYAAAN